MRRACEESLAAIKKHHAAALRLEAEPIHQIRVGTRRLRAMLRIFESLFDAQWAQELEAELRWLAHLLGSVRDFDVLRERLRDAVGPKDRPAMLYLQRILSARHRAAQAAMKEGLRSERYTALLDRLQMSTLAPSVTTQAGAPALEVMLPELKTSWKKLSTSAASLKTRDDSTKFHHVRKAGKRVRYSCEAMIDELPGKKGEVAKTFIKRLKKLQDTLGELQDAVVAAETVEQIVELKSSHRAGLSRIANSQKKAEQKARKKFRSVWARTTRRELRDWMK